MSNKRISELNNLPANQVASGDLMLIVDISLPETKNITAGDVANYVLNNGNITASVYGTASYANIAGYALSAPVVTQVAYATSSLSSSWASSSLNSISSSYSFNSTTASYALNVPVINVNNVQNADSSSYLIYNGGYNGTASYSVNSGISTNSITSSYALIASTALSIATSGNNMSGNVNTMTLTNIYGYDTGSGAYIRNTASESICAQIDTVIVNSPYTTTNAVNITARGLVQLINYTGVYESYYNPTVTLVVQNLYTGVTQSLASVNYQSNVLANHAAGSKQMLRYFLNGTTNLNGTYRIYAQTSWLDDCYGNMDFYFYNQNDPTIFRVVGSAYNLIIESGNYGNPTVIGGTYPQFTDSNNNYLQFNVTSSWNLHGLIMSSVYSGLTANQLVLANSSSYVTYLSASALDPEPRTLTGIYTLQTLNTIILDNCWITHIDGISPSVISMSLVNCPIDGLPPLSGSIPYKLSYLNISCVASSNNGNVSGSITDVSQLPPSMSYLNVAGNPINYFGSSLPYGLQYLNASNCSLQLSDMDQLTCMLVSDISGSYGNSTGSLDISLNVGLVTSSNYPYIDTTTLTWYNISSSIAGTGNNVILKAGNPIVGNLVNIPLSSPYQGMGVGNWTVYI